MKVAIIGYGRQGKAALDYWQEGNDVTVCDKNESLTVPAGVATQLGKDHLANLDVFDLIIRSPIVHPRDIVAANSEAILEKVTTVTEEFMRVCPAPIIGVTGTKGKGTTSTLIANILKAAGKTVHLGGNIGIPPLEMLKWGIMPTDWVVLELANFQLIDLSLSPQIAVCLMVVPEHMDWHTDEAEYITAKQQLFAHQTDDQLAVYNRGNTVSKQVASISLAQKLSYEVPAIDTQPTETTGAYVRGNSIYMDNTEICKTSDIKLLGRHNLENVCAAIAATWHIIGHNPDAIQKALSAFTGLEHRLELVREYKAIKYYDDSFGTTPETAITALEAIDAPKILILGGSDKGASYDRLAQAVTKNNVRTVVQIGKTGPAIAAALKTAGFTNIIDGGSTIQTIVQAAQSAAQPGDAIVLSTACASFDMFKDYIDRGEQFKATVMSLV